MFSVIDQIQNIIEKNCLRSTLREAYGTDPMAYVQAESNCQESISLMKSIVCKDLLPNDKVMVFALDSRHVKDFERIIQHRCNFVDDEYRIRGLELDNLIALGPATGHFRPLNSNEWNIYNGVMQTARVMRCKRIWKIEDWR